MTRNYLIRLALFVALILLVTILCSSCSSTPSAPMSHRVQILMPDGSVVEGTAERWGSCDYRAQAVHIMVDGVTYHTHMSRIVMVAEEAGE